MTDNHRDTIIIGAGPAGIAAAIQLHRYDLGPLIIERDCVGGLLPNANLVENYPGFPGGISGRELAELFTEQLHSYHPEILHDEVTSVDFISDRFVISTAKAELTADHLIISTGTKPREIESLPRISEHHLIYEIAEVMHEKEKEFVVVGAGDIAFDYALNLSRHSRVTILNRSKIIKALPLLRERVHDSVRIEYLDSATIDNIETANGEKVTVMFTREGDRHTIDADYAVFALGRIPNLDFLTPGLLDAKEKLIDEDRLFCVGDAANGALRQTSIAVGQAVRAAMMIAGVSEGSERWN